MENYKVFVKLGNQKNPKWTVGKVLENYFDGTCLVETHGQQMVLSYQYVKAYKKANYDDVIEFTNKNWNALKSIIRDAMEEFFPEMEINIDEKEKIIYTMQNQLSIGGGIFEIETLSSFEYVAQWSVVAYKSVPATRHEPEDVDEVFLGNSANNISAAKIFIDSIWNLKHEDYWENKRYEASVNE